MNFEHTRVMNFDGAFRGLRNPLESWDKSDSWFGILPSIYDFDYPTEWNNTIEKIIESRGVPVFEPEYDDGCLYYTSEALNLETELERKATLYESNGCTEYALIGPADMDLAQRLIKAGSSHRKFMRQIFVCVDITAPIFLWKEFDTYKVATVANSTSTMHKLSSTQITPLCFEMTDCDLDDKVYQEQVANMLDFLEGLRNKYLATKDKKYWKELIRWLPESWLQTRTVTLNYEVLIAIYLQREGHKLTEWKAVLKWIESLPYADELILYAIKCYKDNMTS